MKKMLILAAALLLVGTVGRAALTEKDLTPAAVQKTMAETPAANRQAVARQILEAISAQPADDAAKVQSLVSASRALLQGGGSIAVIAEIFNTIPVAYLQSVAELLARENFNQAANGMTDEQYDAFCSRVVSSAAKYIEASGSDSPAVRISILAATFSAASSDPDRTRPKMIAALPTAMQAAAATFVLASEAGNREVIAAAAGVDEVTDPAADPDAGKVADAKTGAIVTATDPAASAATAPAMAAEDDYLEPTPPPASSDLAADEAGEPDVRVPLLSYFASDVLGIAISTGLTTLYNWEEKSLLPPHISFEPAPELFPGEMSPMGHFTPPPSPGYGNQGI